MRSQDLMPSSTIQKTTMKASFIWDGKSLDEARFHARACLLAVVGRQQNPDSLNRNTKEEHHSLDDSDSDDDGSDATTIAPRMIVKTSGKAKLKESFLDRLAEVLSREKPQPGEKAEHVAATAMMEGDDEATIYVAKNGGLDDVDRSMLHVLKIWVRAIAADGRRRDITKDAMWKKLIDYYQKRLNFYRQGLLQGLEPYLTRIDSEYATAKRLSGLARLRASLAAVGTDWCAVVHAAYELQFDKSGMSDVEKIAKEDSRRLWQSIRLLGRLRVAYETFIEGALHLAIFKKVNIVANDAGLNEEVADKASRPLPPMVSAHFKMLTSKQRKACKLKLAKPCSIHAEVQLLMQLEPVLREDSNAARVFNYIGCSKRTCFLCCKLIGEHGFFRTRGTHGKVYDQWSIPTSHELPIASVFRIMVALVDIESDMITRFENSLCSRELPLVAESSIGNSEHSATSMHRHRLRQVGLETEGLYAVDSDKRREDPPVTKLGKRRTSFRAARIPQTVEVQ